MKPFAEYTWRCSTCGREQKTGLMRPTPRCSEARCAKYLASTMDLQAIRIVDPLTPLPEKTA